MADAAERRPNVLLIVSDDQRFDTIRALTNDEIQTPNLDRLVRNGFSLTHAFRAGRAPLTSHTVEPNLLRVNLCGLGNACLRFEL